MIVPMKKISLVCLEKEKSAALESLGLLGTLHVHQENPQSSDLNAAMEKKLRFESALQLLDKTKESPKAYQGTPEALASDILDLQNRIDDTHGKMAEVHRLIESFKDWGDYDPKTLEDLRAKGFFPRLYSLTAEKFPLLADLGNVVLLSKDKTLARILVVQKDETPLANLDPQEWPVLNPSQAKAQLGILAEDLSRLKARLGSYAVHAGDLKAAINLAEKDIAWEQAKASVDSQERLSWLTGYAPLDAVAGLKAEASAKGYGLMIADPGPEDQVPTKIKNSLIPRIIAPVFSLLGTVPGYRERDISLPFLGFFTIFFGMIIGDAGYGMLFLAGGLLMALSSLFKGKGLPDISLLLIVLSSFTVLWGSLTGTWFGNLLAIGDGPVIDFLKGLTVQPFVDTEYNTNNGFVKWVCFTLGVTQLVLAHLWNFITVLKTGNWLKSIAQIGGLVVTTALYPVVLGLVITGQEFSVVKEIMVAAIGSIKPLFAYMFTQDVMQNLMVAGGGVGLVVLFGSQEGNFFKGLGEGLSNILNTVLGAIGWFSDNISYIRLFAVGLAGFAIAESFNKMGMGLFESLGGGAAGFAAAAAVMLFGHSLNLVMALLGVVVHGVRLNMLEYASRLGMEWTGFEYRPLEKKASKS